MTASLLCGESISGRRRDPPTGTFQLLAMGEAR
jgi:hypothetical protein